MSDCIFCKIIKGDIPSSKVYEDEAVLSFLDISPASKGHLLVIPKKHTEDISDLSADDVTSIFSAVQRIAKALPLAVESTGFNLLLNLGSDAGQIVPHIHFHIIPRRKEDGLSVAGWSHLKFSGDHLNEIALDISSKISKE